jgi:FkbM family methyltransferase
MNLKRILRRVRLKLKQWRGIDPMFSIVLQIPKENHGSEYGGWTIEKDSLTSKSIVYAFGVGEDITFDLSIIKKYDCNVLAYDPTPRVHDWLSTQRLPSQFVFFPVGIAKEDALVKFFMPEIETHISHSSQPSKADAHFLELPVKRLSTIMEEQEHSLIDVLKLDIEGFEYGVIDDILATQIPIRQFLVEFHHGMYGFSKEETEQAVAKLTNAGYQLFFASDVGREFSFIKR